MALARRLAVAIAAAALAACAAVKTGAPCPRLVGCISLTSGER